MCNCVALYRHWHLWLKCNRPPIHLNPFSLSLATTNLERGVQNIPIVVHIYYIAWSNISNARLRSILRSRFMQPYSFAKSCGICEQLANCIHEQNVQCIQPWVYLSLSCIPIYRVEFIRKLNRGTNQFFQFHINSNQKQYIQPVHQSKSPILKYNM